jgi:hypothetical protein
MGCPGALALEAKLDIKEETSEFAAEGTAAHAVGEACLLNGTSPSEHIGETFENFECTREMADAVSVYTDYVRSLDGTMLIEEQVDYSRFVPEGFGTSDVVFIHQCGDLLEVIDYKHGKGVKVYAAGNSQGRLYAIGSLETFGFVLGDIKRVKITIVQPRMDNIDSEELAIEDLYQWVREEVRPKAKIAYDLLHSSDEIPEGSFNPSEKACRWCKALGACEAAATHNISIAMEGFEDLTEIKDAFAKTTDMITLEQRGTIQEYLPFFRKWIESFHGETYSLVNSGKKVPGWKLVNGNMRRSWESVEAGKKAMRSAGLKKPDYTVETILSPAQAEKEVSKDKKDKLKKGIKYTQGSPVLVHEKDKREAISTGADCFKDLIKNENENDETEEGI